LLNKSENPFALSFFCVCFRVSGSSFQFQRILSELEEIENFYYNINDLFCCREGCWSWLWQTLSSLWHGLSHLRMEACVLHFMFTKCFCTKLLLLLSLSLTEIPEVVYSTGNFQKCSQFYKGLMGLEFADMVWMLIVPTHPEHTDVARLHYQGYSSVVWVMTWV